MQQGKNKLKDNRGASVILAMGLFLICSMISSVIVVAAASGASRNIKREKQEKAYLSVSSGAEVILTELAKLEQYVARTDRTTYGCWIFDHYNPNPPEVSAGSYTTGGYTNNIYGFKITGGLREEWTDVRLTGKEGDHGGIYSTTTFDDLKNVFLCSAPTEESYTYRVTEPDVSDSDTELEGIFGEMTEEWALKIYMQTPVPEGEKIKFTLTVPGQEDSLLPLLCSFQMDENYNIKITVALDEDKIPAEDFFDYSVTILRDAQVNSDNAVDFTPEPTPVTCEKVHEICYYEPVPGGSSPKLYEPFQFTDGILERKYILVRWNEPKLVKGVSAP